MSSANLTPREMEILNAFISECSSTSVDWAKVAEKANCNTLKYARDKFALIKNKLIAAYENNAAGTNGAADGDNPKPKSTKKTPASKRKKAEADGDDVEETPTKKKAKTAPRKPKATTPADATDGTSTKSNSKSKSATPAETKAPTPAAEEGNGEENGDIQVKAEPNEAGELMDEMVNGA